VFCKRSGRGMEQWSGWLVGMGGTWWFKVRYAFGEVSSVSLVGGRPVGLGNDIVTTGAIGHDIDVAMDKYLE